MLVIYKNGDRFWKNEKGQLHRIGGPAIEWNDGTKEWYINGNLHRVDGPAIEISNGYREWFLNGKQYTEEEYRKNIGEIC